MGHTRQAEGKEVGLGLRMVFLAFYVGFDVRFRAENVDMRVESFCMRLLYMFCRVLYTAFNKLLYGLYMRG